MTADEIRQHLAVRAANAKRWLFDTALPFWWERGFDHTHGVFHERFSMDGEPDLNCPRRSRVQARQTFVFALAGRLGWPGPWREATETGVAALLGPCRGADGTPIFALDPFGAPLDLRADLYDRAFWMFALGTAAGALGERPDIITACEQVHDRMTETWALPQGGFAEGEITPSPPYRQNPHMHLFEAALALFEVTGARRWRDFADQIDTLFSDAFFARSKGFLPEYFDERWKPLPGPEGTIIEPGHHFEWAWLLQRSAELGGTRRWDDQQALVDFAEAFGVDKTNGLTLDEVWSDGTVKSPTARLWPQTERLKAGLALFERTGDPAAGRHACQAYDALALYLDTAVPGLWYDRLEPSGRFRDEPAPASSFYHIALALSELIRVAPPRD